MAKFFALFINYLKETKAELKQVSWLNKNDLIRYTTIVIGISAATAIFLGALDYAFQYLIKSFI